MRKETRESRQSVGARASGSDMLILLRRMARTARTSGRALRQNGYTFVGRGFRGFILSRKVIDVILLAESRSTVKMDDV